MMEYYYIHLQWFAAEDEGRTEEPTEHKIRKAREEGKVAKSGELTSSFILLFGIAIIGIIASYLLQNTIDMMRYFLTSATELDITSDRRIVPAFMHYYTKLVLPTMAVVFIAAFAGNVFQVGFLFTTKTITPDFNKIVPHFGRFFKRAFLSGEAAFNLAKSIFKIVVIGLIAYLNIRMELFKIIHLMGAPFLKSLNLIATIAFRIIAEGAIAMLILAIPDYFFQRKQHLESLKMSKHELKEERKMYEGDPLVKSRLKERMRELLARNMMKAVPAADVVITNPTHYSVAVEWKREIMDAPMVVAKGVNAIAFKIREIAKENDVPLMENKPLARALYQEVDIGDAIPEKYYEVMAIILAEIYKLDGRAAEAV